MAEVPGPGRIRVHFGIPSCRPSSPTETNGTAAEVEPAFTSARRNFDDAETVVTYWQHRNCEPRRLAHRPDTAVAAAGNPLC